MLKMIRKESGTLIGSRKWNETNYTDFGGIIVSPIDKQEFTTCDLYSKKKILFRDYSPSLMSHDETLDYYIITACNDLHEFELFIGANERICGFFLYQINYAKKKNNAFNLNQYIHIYEMDGITCQVIPDPIHFRTLKMNNIYPTIIYNNAFEIVLNKGLPSVYAYRSREDIKNDYIFLVDRNYNINSIVYINIGEDYINQMMKQCKKVEYINDDNLIDQYRIVSMQNNQFLIKQIESLKNINIWELLAYGSFACFVPNELIVDYAADLVRQNKDNDEPIVLQFAEILKPDEEQITAAFEKHFGEKEMFLQSKGDFYNEIWRYLDAAIKMHEKKVL